MLFYTLSKYPQKGVYIDEVLSKVNNCSRTLGKVTRNRSGTLEKEAPRPPWKSPPEASKPPEFVKKSSKNRFSSPETGILRISQDSQGIPLPEASGHRNLGKVRIWANFRPARDQIL